MTLLSVASLGLRREERWHLRGVSFDLRAGEAWGIVGESGAGKTTLMNLILGLLVPSEGEVQLKGEAWSSLREPERRPKRAMIQAVFQDPLASLPPHRTGWEILQEPLVIHRRGDAGSRREFAKRMADRVKFPQSALDQKPHAWSGGLAQRLAVARALMLEPELLVLDEPLSALDPTLAGHLLELLMELKQSGMALLLVSHDLLAVQRLCDQLLVLYSGEPMFQGRTIEALQQLRHPYLRGLWEAVPHVENRSAPLRWGAERLRMVIDGGCLLMDRCPRAQPDCDIAPPIRQTERCHHPFL
jgi:ABC-type glutathione transport system ATPase component